jgi:hypothetical protein
MAAGVGIVARYFGTSIGVLANFRAIAGTHGAAGSWFAFTHESFAEAAAIGLAGIVVGAAGVVVA